MDTLTFNSPILLRHLTFSEAKKAPIAEINLARVLEGMNMEMDQVRRVPPFLPSFHPLALTSSSRACRQFVDLCILMGCDYVEPLKGVGPSTALKLIREHGSLKAVVRELRKKQREREAVVESDEEVVEEVESEEEEEEQEEEDEAVESDVEEYDSDGELVVKEKKEGSLSPKKKKKAAPKKKKAAAKKGKGKGKGGIVIPEDWNWEGAKELFLRPDVTKAEDVEAGPGSLSQSPPHTR